MRSHRKNMRLRDIWSIARGDMVAVVGAGGKTAIMNRLAREFKFSGVIYTTTTAILLPGDLPGCFRAAADEQKLRSLLKKYAEGSQEEMLVLGRGLKRQRPGAEKKLKVIGLNKELVNAIKNFPAPFLILVEADGAARHSGKLPADHEPEVPSYSDQVILVQGAAALGRRPCSPHLFRSELIEKQRINIPRSASKDGGAAVSLRLLSELFLSYLRLEKFPTNLSKLQLVVSQTGALSWRLLKRIETFLAGIATFREAVPAVGLSLLELHRKFAIRRFANLQAQRGGYLRDVKKKYSGSYTGRRRSGQRRSFSSAQMWI
ncbi:selenium cofactor biosynthesis protein YqeC [Halarsenatibacter silvermanii]|uniref:Probable selenium-dependent hydroxylase accessory protein YqeC n=1 Tax=Halarsenatibacter silvermanii TaxID=321763 RepID=A0A1G9I9A2_9FIRM|nr:selenium cofactor biosynthesis protein YqeC [Halarsenatibacter silvermanii]SDL21414.1 probable selenium-dependent hydroxylase accessory protein YqeC [Halarsenatibacter silvermanii]